MEKKRYKKIKEVVLGSAANTVEINGDDAARLIGGIVEKGISEATPFTPTPPPKPTVLPFPVARHRSHGPHWKPISSNKNEDDGEDDDYTDLDPMSAFANPLQRKQKKGLDLRQWRELVSGDDSHLRINKPGAGQKKRPAFDDVTNNNAPKPSEANEAPLEMNSGCSLHSLVKGMANSVDTDSESLTSLHDMEVEVSRQPRVQDNAMDAGTSVISNFQLEQMDPVLGEMRNNFQQENLTLVSSSSLGHSGNERGSMSLENEIDAENHVRLQNMSPEEIAEAQAELMQKMDSSLLAFLKSRGLSKKKNLPRPGLAINVQSGDSSIGQLANIQNENQSFRDSNTSVDLRGDSSIETTARTTKDEEHGPKSGGVRHLGPGSANLWNSWSERVEAVRDLRFSLEGTVIADESNADHSSMKNRHSAGNVAERDYLRTEGDPAATGYTIKEAVQLTRSVIPGQRALALHLIASVLDQAINHIQQNKVGCSLGNSNQIDKLVDWEAIWAYALGPEPELVLALRICLDDNHNSVILACAKVIQYVLTCDLNDNYFHIYEKMGSYEQQDIFTAPVFRTKPEIDDGFIHGGFWKYSAKPSSILAWAQNISDDEAEGQHTIQDDIVVAGQDFAAGLVRMGILTKMRYLLESNPVAALEECIISILIAIARHSPTCANAILKCQRLVHTVVYRFTLGASVDIYPQDIKSVCLLKVLAQSDKASCMEFIKNGYFQSMTRHLYQPASSLDRWVKLGKENCKLSSALAVEQLRFWKVCINYGCCLSYFPNIFPALCMWLTRPIFEKLQENGVLGEFASISAEAYLVLEALARKLPNLHSQKHLSNQTLDFTDDEVETWSWNYVTPVVDLALTWIASKSDPTISKLFDGTDCKFPDTSACSLLWVFSSVMHMLSTILERVKLEDDISSQGKVSHLPWLPEFVPKVGLEIIKQGFFSFSDASGMEYGKDFTEDGSFIEVLCYLRQQDQNETSLASICCLHRLLRTMTSTDSLINLAKTEIHSLPSHRYSSSREGKILEDGIQRRSVIELRLVLNHFMKFVSSEWLLVQSIEIFGRGGPAPGVGVGWGASGGGFWSIPVLLAYKDAELLVDMLSSFQALSCEESNTDEDMVLAMQRINSILEVCLICGPRDRVTVNKALDILLQVPYLRQLSFCIQHFLQSRKDTKQFGWEYNEEECLLLGRILSSHYKNRWLAVKKKVKPMDNNNTSRNKISKKHVSLSAIHEDLDSSSTMNEDSYCSSLKIEWAHQRLPLPLHWLLSSIVTTSEDKHNGLRSASSDPNVMQDTGDIVEVARSGLFFLLGTEAMSSIQSTNAPSPVQSIPLIWKLHALSVTLLAGMGVLEDDKSRNIYEALQHLYAQLLDRARFTQSADCTIEEHNLMPKTMKKPNAEFLRFQSEIQESYATFIEALVDQFSAVSYGDIIFGRQIALYLHRCTEAPVRLATWNALVNAHVLEIMPPLKTCIAEADGYLYPIEDNDGVLEAYVKSWVSGALDRAVIRGSMAFTLVVHHVSSFIFVTCADDKKSLRNKLVKFLLRDYSQNHKHEGMMLDFVRYNKLSTSNLSDHQFCLSPHGHIDIEQRFQVLVEACETNSSLLSVVEKLKSTFVKEERVLH